MQGFVHGAAPLTGTHQFSEHMPVSNQICLNIAQSVLFCNAFAKHYLICLTSGLISKTAELILFSIASAGTDQPFICVQGHAQSILLCRFSSLSNCGMPVTKQHAHLSTDAARATRPNHDARCHAWIREGHKFYLLEVACDTSRNGGKESLG